MSVYINGSYCGEPYQTLRECEDMIEANEVIDDFRTAFYGWDLWLSNNPAREYSDRIIAGTEL